MCTRVRQGSALLEALQIAKAQRLEATAGGAPAAAAGSHGAVDERVPLSRGTVRAVVAGGNADRVALDFTCLLGEHPPEQPPREARCRDSPTLHARLLTARLWRLSTTPTYLPTLSLPPSHTQPSRALL